jgi:hypothetical protein
MRVDELTRETNKLRGGGMHQLSKLSPVLRPLSDVETTALQHFNLQQI